MSPSAPVPHAHQSIMIQGCRQAAQGPAAPSAPTDLWNQQQEPTSKLQSRPLWTSPLVHHPFPKAEDTDRANSFAPQHSHKSPACPALGKAVSCCHFCPAPQAFPLLTQAKGATPPALPVCPNPKEMLAGRQRPQSPRKGEVQVREPLWGARSRNCGVGERGLA